MHVSASRVGPREGADVGMVQIAGGGGGRPAIEDKGPVWRIKFGNVAQIGTMLGVLTLLVGAATFTHSWSQDHKAETAKHDAEVAAGAEAKGRQDQVLIDLANSVRLHTEALKDLTVSLSSIREDVRRVEGKIEHGTAR